MQFVTNLVINQTCYSRQTEFNIRYVTVVLSTYL